MDWRKRNTHYLLGETVTVTVDRPVGYRHGDIRYPINYGFVPGIMGGDGEAQDAYILGITEPVEQFTGQVIGVIRRHNDCEDKLVVAKPGTVCHQGQIAEAVQFQEQYFISTIDCLLRKSCGVIPYRQSGNETEYLIVFEQFSQCWSLPKGHMEAGETEVQTALRELYEETGLTARLFTEETATIRYGVGPKSEKQVVFFLGKVNGEIILPQQEIATCRWIIEEELGQYLFPDTAAAAKQLIYKYRQQM